MKRVAIVMPKRVWIAHRVDGSAWLAESFRTRREALYWGRSEGEDDGSRWMATQFAPLTALPFTSDPKRRTP